MKRKAFQSNANRQSVFLREHVVWGGGGCQISNIFRTYAETVDFRSFVFIIRVVTQAMRSMGLKIPPNSRQSYGYHGPDPYIYLYGSEYVIGAIEIPVKFKTDEDWIHYSDLGPILTRWIQLN